MLLKSNGPDLSLKMTIYEQMRFKGQKVFQGKEPAVKGPEKRARCNPAAALLRRHGQRWSRGQRRGQHGGAVGSAGENLQE